MNVVKYLIMGAAFLMVISSAISLFGTTLNDKTPVYVNIGAMVCLIAAITFINFEKGKKR